MTTIIKRTIHRLHSRSLNKDFWQKAIVYLVKTPKRLHSLIVRDHVFLVIRRIEKKIVRRWLMPQSSERILDIACGKGNWSTLVTTKGAQYFGTDLDFTDVMKAKKRYPESSFVNIDAENNCFQPESFDKLFSNCSLEHFRDDVQALKGMYDALKPGGSLVLTVDSLSNPNFPVHLRKKHKKEYDVVRYYTVEHLNEKLEDCGFKLIDYKYYLNSKLSEFFYALGVRFGLNGWVLYLFPFSYPLTVIGDKFFSFDQGGCGLAIHAVKIDNQS